MAVVVSSVLTDIVAERFDAGMRWGGIVAEDMTAVRIGPDMRMAAVAAPAYVAGRAKPRRPEDLAAHACINLRLPTHGGLYTCGFEKDGRELRVRVARGSRCSTARRCSSRPPWTGSGSPNPFEGEVRAHLEAGTLVLGLEDGSDPFPGYHLDFPSRREPEPALAVLVAAPRYRG